MPESRETAKTAIFCYALYRMRIAGNAAFLHPKKDGPPVSVGPILERFRAAFCRATQPFGQTGNIFRDAVSCGSTPRGDAAGDLPACIFFNASAPSVFVPAATADSQPLMKVRMRLFAND
jgi:hypothetical protein